MEDFSEAQKYLKAIELAKVPYTVNPPVSFITGGTGKVIKFHHPLDLRTVEEKMQRYPFVSYRS